MAFRKSTLDTHKEFWTTTTQTRSSIVHLLWLINQKCHFPAASDAVWHNYDPVIQSCWIATGLASTRKLETFARNVTLDPTIPNTYSTVRWFQLTSHQKISGWDPFNVLNSSTTTLTRMNDDGGGYNNNNNQKNTGNCIIALRGQIENSRFGIFVIQKT